MALLLFAMSSVTHWSWLLAGSFILAAPFYISALYLFEHDWRWRLRWLAIAII
jgi:hypothetical protein